MCQLGGMSLDRETDIDPARNVIPMPNFFALLMDVFQRKGSGRATIMRSLTMWGRLIQVPKVLKSMHLLRSRSTLHMVETGLQIATEGTHQATALVMRNKIVICVARRMYVSTLKMRRYMQHIESFGNTQAMGNMALET